jgi:hypothetical protein
MQVDRYVIYRWDVNGNSLIDTVPGSAVSYSDITAPSGSLYYQIEAQFDNLTCSPTRGKTGTYGNSQSNVINLNKVGLYLPSVEGFELYPNPTRDQVQLKWESHAPARLLIRDMQGRLLYQKALGIAQRDLTLSLGHWAQGMYILHFEQEGRQPIIRKIEVKE